MTLRNACGDIRTPYGSYMLNQVCNYLNSYWYLHTRCRDYLAVSCSLYRKPYIDGITGANDKYRITVLWIFHLCTIGFNNIVFRYISCFNRSDAPTFSRKIPLGKVSIGYVVISATNSQCAYCDMMTSSNGNIFRVTGPLCGEFTGPGEFPTQRPVTRSFDVYFDLRLNKRLSKQSRGWWFETLSRSLWRHRNDIHGYERNERRGKSRQWGG